MLSQASLTSTKGGLPIRARVVQLIVKIFTTDLQNHAFCILEVKLISINAKTGVPELIECGVVHKGGDVILLFFLDIWLV